MPIMRISKMGKRKVIIIPAEFSSQFKIGEQVFVDIPKFTFATKIPRGSK